MIFRRKKLKGDIEELIFENRADPRQKDCWAKFIDPTSKTYSNAYASAMAAGYAHNYARVIRGRDWFRDKMRRAGFVSKAEKVMDKILDKDAIDEKGLPKADVLRVQSDVAKHITKTLGKDDGYSERTEVQGGSNIVFLPMELMDKYNLGKKEEVENKNKED